MLREEVRVIVEEHGLLPVLFDRAQCLALAPDGSAGTIPWMDWEPVPEDRLPKLIEQGAVDQSWISVFGRRRISPTWEKT